MHRSGKQNRAVNIGRYSRHKIRCLPEELAESLVVGDGFIVVLGEAVLNVLETPLLHQLAG